MRPQLFAGVSGIILDAGVGTGRNLPFYPEGSRVTGVDSSPGMIARARERRDKLGKNVELLEMNVLATAFPDRHFDTIVATFLFCVLDDDQQLPALRELECVCRPGGVICNSSDPTVQTLSAQIELDRLPSPGPAIQLTRSEPPQWSRTGRFC